MDPKVSVIYVNYKSGGDLMESIGSLISSNPKVSYEIIVVDNSPKDKISSVLKKLRKKVNYIKQSKNLGYGAGNNLGAEKAKGKYLMIVNPDTLIKKGVVDKLSSFLDKRINAAVVAPNLIDERGQLFEDIGARELTPLRAIFSLSFISKIFPKNGIKREYRLEDISKNKLREANAVPGSAFMIRKKIFDEVGGYDGNIFMYFEESDLGKRVSDFGYKLFINPEAEVVHKWKQKGKRKNVLNKIFMKSRFYYFRKHFGIFWALVVEMFTRFTPTSTLVILLIATGAFLRCYKLYEFATFSGDGGFYFLQAKEMMTGGEFPLASIPTSVPTFRQGAIFIWMLGVVLKIFNFNPISAFYFAALMNSFALILLYLMVKNTFGKQMAVSSVILASFSPLIVSHSRRVSVITPIFLFTIISFWLFEKAIRSKSVNCYFFLGVILSVLYQFELAAFTLFIIYGITFLVFRRRISVKQIAYTLIGIFIGMIPLIAYDLRNGVFIQTIGFFIWAVTKPFENLLLRLSGGGAKLNYDLGINLIGELVFPFSKIISVLLIILAPLLFIKKKINKLTGRKKPEEALIIIWFLVTLLSFFARGIFSEAYMPFTFLPTIIILSTLFIYVIKKAKLLGWLMLVVFAFFNIFFLLKTNFLVGNTKLGFNKKIEAARYIVKDSKGEKYKLIYQGAGDMYDSGGNNYQYLLWWLGNEPVIHSQVTYKIIERGSVSPEKVPFEAKWIGDIAIVREEL